MGERTLDLARTLVRHSNRKRLRGLLKKHPHLLGEFAPELLNTAAGRGNLVMLRWLLERGADTEARDCRTSGTVLMTAACDGLADAMRLLLDFGANMYALNSMHENALGYAVTNDHIDCIRVLGEYGMDMNNMDDSGPLGTQLDVTRNDEVKSVLREYGGKLYRELGWSNNWSEGDFLAIEIAPAAFAFARVLPFPTLTFYDSFSKIPAVPDLINQADSFSVWTHWSACDCSHWTPVDSQPLTAEEQITPLLYHRDMYMGSIWHVKGVGDLVRVPEVEAAESEAALFWLPSQIEQRLRDLRAGKPNELHEARRLANQPPPDYDAELTAAMAEDDELSPERQGNTKSSQLK